MNDKRIKICPELELWYTGHDYDFIATVENQTDRSIKLIIKPDDNGLDHVFDLGPREWFGILADEMGRYDLECLENGEYEVEVQK